MEWEEDVDASVENGGEVDEDEEEIETEAVVAAVVYTAEIGDFSCVIFVVSSNFSSFGDEDEFCCD